MSNPPSKPPKPTAPVKPFLGDDDLSELDAWGSTFDALHDAAALHAESALHAAPMLEATADAAEPMPEPMPEPNDLGELPDFHSDLGGDHGSDEPTTGGADTRNEDRSTLDRALDDGDDDDDGGELTRIGLPDDPEMPAFFDRADPLDHPGHRAPTSTMIDIPADETDFSAVGASSPAMPLPSLLRTMPGVPPGPRLPTPADELAAFADEDDDDGVFTSASRHGLPAVDESMFDDAPVQPPAREPRRSPAIVRRERPTLPPEPRASDSDAMFSEQTRVADFGELEQRVVSSRQSQPTLPPPIVDEDDYADIEIGDEKQGGAPPASEPLPQVAPPADVFPTTRRTAHVLRRGDSASRRPPQPPPGRLPAVGFDLDEEPAPRRALTSALAEDDFSDVAAAVGATDDLDLPSLPSRPTPRAPYNAVRPPEPGEPGSSIPEIELEPRKRATLDEALAGLPLPDDSSAFEAHHALDEAIAFDDAPVYEAPADDASDVVTPQPEPFVPRPGFDPNAFDDEFASESGSYDERQAFDDPNEFEDDFAPPPALPAVPPPISPPPIVPPPIAPPRAAPTSTAPPLSAPPVPRPPGLADLYPRIKTPTSVPPMGGKPPTPPPGALSGSSLAPTRTLLEFVPVTPVPPAAPAPAPPPAGPRSTRLATPLPLDPDAAPELEPVLDLETAGRAWPEQVAPLPTAELDEASAQALLVYERELMTVDETAASTALRIEAGRLCERLTDFERARGHYDAALMLDPRATPALRGLRRLARTSGDLAEAIRHLDAEISVAGALERRPLSHYRVDLMMASNEQDLARVAAGELLDQAPSDVRALLAQLELAFLDGRADEFGVALEQLAQAVTDTELRAALQSARGALAAHHNDTGAAAGWFAAAAESDPTALAALLGAIRQATADNQADAAARAMLDLARQVETSDPITAAAAAVRAQQWVATGELSQAAATLAIGAAANDPLVARLAAHHLEAAAADDPTATADAFIHWAHNAGSNAERAYAAARAAELDPSRGRELWASALALDPGDDYAAAQLRTAHVAAEATQAAIDVDLAIAADAARDRARLRAAYGMIAQSQLDAAIAVLQQGRAERSGSVALSEALGEALAAAGKWTERAKLFAELADEPGEQLDKDVAQLRSALAWEEAVGAVASAEPVEPAADPGNASDSQATGRAGVVVTTAAALDAWERVLERGSSPSAHAAAIVLATRLGDTGIINEALARAQAAERLPLAAASLGLRRARLIAHEDPQRHESILRDLTAVTDDPRRTLGLIVGAARRRELSDAAAALEERANAIEARTLAGEPPGEIAALRLRAAQLALDANEATKATALLHKVEQALPQLGVVADLLAAARRRAGDRLTTKPLRRVDPPPTNAAGAADAFARIVRDADLAAAQGDAATALGMYQRALELRPNDPLAAVPLIRVATQLREPAPIAALALAQLRLAEEAGDGVAKACAYELLAHIDGDLRGDAGSAQIALESAAAADPSRIDLLHRLERHYAAGEQLAELVRLRTTSALATPRGLDRDRVGLLVDLAGIASRDGRPELELADLYRQILAVDARTRLALMHLEAIVRRSGFSPELAELEEQIAAYFEGDAKTCAAFWTRAGETLADLGKIDDAVQRFGKADATLPGHVPALEGWRQAALKGQLWVDVAEAATRQAAGAEAHQKAQLHHFAGVALMDKALIGDQAMTAFRRALDAEPSHKDAFLRLRILLEEDANHDELAILLANRLAVEAPGHAKVELHRALAELNRNFLSDRDTAKHHFRAVLESEPNDLHAYGAIADIAWEQGNWQEAADALMARARLERSPEVLKQLCFRLGTLYADRLNDVPMALRAFQRALTYQPDDVNTLVRLAELATVVGEWKLALSACERLVKNETDPDLRATHLHRVARIFKQGFGDLKRAERALNLALDGAPTNDEALGQLVQFYRDANDITSVRVHLNRVAGAMRARVTHDPQDGIAYRVIARTMAARANAGVPGSLPIARAAAELADLLGASGEPEQKLLQTSRQPDLSLITKAESDEVIFPRGVPVELRHIFQLLGDRIAKHVGVDLRPYGVTRGDRLRARDNPVAAVAQSVATGLGFAEIDVYISNRQPWVMVAEPTSPVSLVIGSAIAAAGGDTIRFAAGAALKLAQSSLAIPARLANDDLGVLILALLRLFQPDFPIIAINAEAVAAQAQKLRRLIPTGLMNELKPFALGVDAQSFNHTDLARDLRVAGLRAGLVASGSLVAGLRILAAQLEAELPGFLADPLAQGLIAFALGEDHAVVAR
jgi:hypothetical protein